MDLLLILTYTAICVGIFKIFKIPLNKWTVPTAVLGGVFIKTEHSVFFGDELFSVLDRVDRNVLEGAEGSGASREAMHHVNSPVIGYQTVQVC